MNTNELGRLTQAKVMTRLLEMGKHVLVPFANIGKYDLLIDNENGTFQRVECKTGQYREGCILFSTCYSNRSGTVKREYIGSADLFAVWCKETDKVYVISVDECPTRQGRLRVEDPKGPGNLVTIRWAKDYEV